MPAFFIPAHWWHTCPSRRAALSWPRPMRSSSITGFRDQHGRGRTGASAGPARRRRASPRPQRPDPAPGNSRIGLDYGGPAHRRAQKGESESDRNAFAPPGATATPADPRADHRFRERRSPLTSSRRIVRCTIRIRSCCSKNSPGLRRYLRKAFLRFDLGALRDRRIAEATLTLNFEATGFGYASLVGEKRLWGVWGHRRRKEDDWSAATLTWENAPAFSPDGGSADPGRATKLGTFTLPEGVVSGTPSLGGPALTAFLSTRMRIARRRSSSSANFPRPGQRGGPWPPRATGIRPWRRRRLRLTLAER